MPHIIIEYAAPIAEQHDLDKLCKALFDAALETGVFKSPKDVKVRAIPATHWYLQTENDSFIHVTVRLLTGRTTEQKASVTNAMLKTADQLLPEVGSISVDIKELDPATYAKRSV
jgi:5-carboxymethyl-2-hydroxymuconate isomerase